MLYKLYGRYYSDFFYPYLPSIVFISSLLFSCRSFRLSIDNYENIKKIGKKKATMFDRLLAIASVILLCKCAPWNAYTSRELNREPGRETQQGITVVEVESDGGFWFADFTVGTSRNLSLLVDTGSADVGLNTGNYKPSSHGINLNMIGQDAYGTTQSNGCGSSLVRFSPFRNYLHHSYA